MGVTAPCSPPWLKLYNHAMTQPSSALPAVPAPAQSSPKPKARTLRSLFAYLWQPSLEMRARVIAGVFLLIAAKVASVYAPIFYKHAIDALNMNTAQLAVVVPTGLIIAYVLARIGTMAFAELREALFAKVAFSAMRQVALDVFKHLHRLSLRFHLERRTGGLSRVIERGTQGIESFLRLVTWFLGPTILEILLTTAVLFYFFGWPIVVVTFATIAVYMVYTLSITEWRLQIRRTVNAHNTTSNSKAIDSLLNYETVKYFGNEAHEAARYDSTMRLYAQAQITSRSSLSLLNVGQSVIISVGLGIVMYIAARGIVTGGMTVGDFVMVNTYMLQLYMPLNFLGSAYRETREAMIDMEKMFELLAVNQEVADAPNAATLAVGEGRIVFDHVSFGYDPRRPILHDVSFVAEPGQTVAIVGPSGAGKSTLSRLLFRFYDVGAGSISIDGQNIAAVTQASLRNAIGIVPQDTVLFNDTIAYNIGYGHPGASMDEIREAARLAQIDAFCQSLPDGYDTVVGERGLKLSGGEKQRVAIARTILKNPRLLMFDEATSALDTHTEKEIQASLKAVSEGRTTLVIAHRLSTIADADLILVLEGGRIVERGSHAALLAQGGLYTALWKKQQETEARYAVSLSGTDHAATIAL